MLNIFFFSPVNFAVLSVRYMQIVHLLVTIVLKFSFPCDAETSISNINHLKRVRGRRRRDVVEMRRRRRRVPGDAAVGGHVCLRSPRQ